MNKRYCYYVILIMSIFFVGCSKKESKQVDLSERKFTENQAEYEIKSEILEGPKELNSEFMTKYFTLHMKEMPVMIFEMKEKKSDSLSYIISRMKDGYTWESEKLEWNNKKIKDKKLSLLSVAMNEENELWGVFVDVKALEKGKTSTILIKLYSDGTSEEVTMKEGSDKGVLQNIIFASDSKLILQYLIVENLSSPESEDSPYYTLMYDTVNMKVILESNDVGFLGYNIDEDFIICDANRESKCITGRKIGEKVPEFALKCGKEIPAPYSILKKDDFVYYMLDDGLYGGKVTDKECKRLIPSDKMILPSKNDLSKELMEYSDSITNDMAIAFLYKMPGDDKEFLCLTKKRYDSQEAQWIHYYE